MKKTDRVTSMLTALGDLLGFASRDGYVGVAPVFSGHHDSGL